MTIETGSAQNTSRPAATESKHAKGKPGDAHAQGAGGTGGFMAILASMDTPEPAGSCLVLENPAALALAALQRASAALKGTGATDAASLGDASGDLCPESAEAAIDKLLQDSAADLAATAALPVPVDMQLQQEVPIDTSALLAQAAQWAATPAANAEQPKPTAANGAATNLLGVTKSPLVPAQPDSAALAGNALGDVASDLAGKAGKAQKDAFSRLAAAQAALVEPEPTNNPAADARLAQVLQKVAETPMNPIATAMAAASTVAPVRREEVARERSVFRSNAPESTAPGQTYLPSASPGALITAPEPVATMDTYVAEKVAYWISNDVQNAEMKLDGIGEFPVEVSIRMQGNEAHIAFRTDELQARAALENASLHLKEMLQREGLVLSGVSVGTAGTGDAGSQDRKSRQGVRQLGVVSVQPARAEGVADLRRSTGGAVDLFV